MIIYLIIFAISFGILLSTKKMACFGSLLTSCLIACILTIIINCVAYGINYKDGETYPFTKEYKVEKFYGNLNDTIATYMVGDSELSILYSEIEDKGIKVMESKDGDEETYQVIKHFLYPKDNWIFTTIAWPTVGENENVLFLNKENYEIYNAFQSNSKEREETL